ncbi:MAG: phosphatase [Subdoligranulum sp.]|nr:phosphatase [Subdoligranulum sp.]MBS6537741.1 phosphatase [Subdoligranulum variabile]
MKKTTFGAVLAFLFAAAGALTAAALYLYHREKELDEYERLLFSDDYEDDDYDDEDSTTYENIPSAPAEEKE